MRACSRRVRRRPAGPGTERRGTFGSVRFGLCLYQGEASPGGSAVLLRQDECSYVEVDTGHMHKRGANVRSRGGAAKSSRIQGNKNTGPLSTPRAGDHRYGRALNSTRPGHGKQPRWGTTDAWPIPPGSLCVGWLTGWSLLRRASSCPLGLSSRRSHYSVVPVPGLPLLGLIDIEQMGAKFDPIASLND